MSFTVAQDQEYQGDDWWKWSVWIEGTDTDLDHIQEVTYRLHASFPKPLRTTADRSNRFKLKGQGWDVFTIHVKVLLKDGGVEKLKHYLKLSYPDGTSNTD